MQPKNKSKLIELNGPEIKKNRAGRPIGAKTAPKPIYYELSKKGFDVSVELVKLYEQATLVEDKIDLMKSILKYIYAVPAPLYQKVEATQNNLTVNEAPRQAIGSGQTVAELMKIVKGQNQK